MDIGPYEIVLGTSLTAVAGFCLVGYSYYRNHIELEIQKLLTHTERADADIRKMEEIKKLLNDDGYIKYLDKRVDVCKKLDLPKDTFPIRVKELIDAVVGPYSFEEKKE